MQTDPFFEDLESELTPFSDEQVDLISSATESDLRYRLEIWVLYVLAAVVPTFVLLIGLYLVRAWSVQGIARIGFLLAIFAAMFGAVRGFKMQSGRYARWRYRSAFLRQLAAAKARLGR